MVTHQLHVRCRPVKVRRSETDVLPLSHPSNRYPWDTCKCNKLHFVYNKNESISDKQHIKQKRLQFLFGATSRHFIGRLRRLLICHCWFIGRMNFSAPEQCNNGKSDRQPVPCCDNIQTTTNALAGHMHKVRRFEWVSARRRLSPMEVHGLWIVIR